MLPVGEKTRDKINNVTFSRWWAAGIINHNMANLHLSVLCTLSKTFDPVPWYTANSILFVAVVKKVVFTVLYTCKCCSFVNHGYVKICVFHHINIISCSDYRSMSWLCHLEGGDGVGVRGKTAQAQNHCSLSQQNQAILATDFPAVFVKTRTDVCENKNM